LFQVELPAFRGPLDLLLRVIEQQALDISTLSLARVTEQYLQHLRSGKDIDPDELADFIVVAAKLLWIKSCSLLPRPPAREAPGEEELDPGEDLVRRLEEYQVFKAVAVELKQMQEDGRRSYSRIAPPPVVPTPRLRPDGVSIEALARAFQEVLKRRPPEPEPLVEPLVVSVAERLAEIEARLHREAAIGFTVLLEECSSRAEMIVTFLALLELLHQGRARARQPSPFGEILILKPAA